MKKRNKSLMQLVIGGFLLLSLWMFPASVYGADGGSRVEVAIWGQLLDEADEPLAEKDVFINFYLGEGDSPWEEWVRTDSAGGFQVSAAIPQQAYINSGRYCTSIHAMVFFGGSYFEDPVVAVDYTAGDIQEVSDLTANHDWGSDGRYTGEYFYLFQNTRIGSAVSDDPENESESAADFDHMTIKLGSRSDPCVFRLERIFTITESYINQQGAAIDPPQTTANVAGRSRFTGDPPEVIQRGDVTYQYLGWRYAGENGPEQEKGWTDGKPEIDVTASHQIEYGYDIDETVLLVKHLSAMNGAKLAEDVEHTFKTSETSVFEVTAEAVAAMAPITVELSGETVAEAYPQRPITKVDVSVKPGEMEVIFFYHPDRDGDQVPDHLVEEAFLRTDGSALAGKENTVTVLAHRDTFSIRPPSIAGYTHRRSTVEEDSDQEQEADGQSGIIVTGDVAVRHFYQQNGNGGAGGGNKEEQDGQEPLEEKPIPEPEEPGEGDGEEPPSEESEGPQEDGSREPPLTAEEEKAVEITEVSKSSGALPPIPTLTEEEREERRNVTFVKRSLRKDVAAGEEVAYSFSGFENAFPYSLTDFTIIDRPDQGLDFQSIDLPAFREGAGITYDLNYATNKRPERTLLGGLAADQPQRVVAPNLPDGEHITEIYVRLEQAPPGFGVGNAIEITFRVWEEPPTEELHNLGALSYEEQGRLVELQAEEEAAAVTVTFFDLFDGMSQGDHGILNNGFAEVGQSAAPPIWKYVTMMAAAMILTAVVQYRKRNVSG